MEDISNKVNNGGATPAGQLDSGEWNQPMKEVKNVIEDTGQSLSGGDLDQLGKGIADYVGNGGFYTDSGAADAYVLSPVGSKKGPTAYTVGLTAEFIPDVSNAGASTVNINGLGVVNLFDAAGAAIPAGIIVAGVPIKLMSDGTDMLIASSNPLGIGQKWKDVTGSRTIGTNYTNNTLRPIMVSAVCQGTGQVGVTIVGATVGGVIIQRTTTSQSAGEVGDSNPLSFIVPPASLYSVNDIANVSSLIIWSEMV